MTPEIMQILVPTLTAIIASVGTLMATKNTNRKDITMSDRKALSDDEKAFRQELKDTINSYKADLDQSREEIKKSREEIRRLSVEVAQLHQINLELTLENKSLHAKMDDLRTALKTRGVMNNEMD